MYIITLESERIDEANVVSNETFGDIKFKKIKQISVENLNIYSNNYNSNQYVWKDIEVGDEIDMAEDYCKSIRYTIIKIEEI